MGYTYTEKAGAVLDRFRARHCGKSQNTYNDQGRAYFFEEERVRQWDDGIRGEIYRFYTYNDQGRTHFCASVSPRARQVGTFHIDGAGRVLHGPDILKACEAQRRESVPHGTTMYADTTEENPEENL